MTTETSNARGEWVLVPRVPTKAMIDAWRDAPDIWEDAYAAMLAAAPPPAGDAEVWLFKGTDGAWHTFHNEQHRLDTIADGRWDVRKFYALAPPPAAARGDVRGLVAKLAAHVRPTCSELWDEAQAFLAAEGVQAVDGCHCATCTCEPNMAPAVRFDLSPAQKEGAIREHLVRLGWTPPVADAEAKAVPVPTRVHLIGETAVIVGTPGRGWDEEGPEAHNCDAMGCATIGPHVLARVPFTDERALTAAQQQGQAVADDMGGFSSDTAALAFLSIIGNGNPNVEHAVERLRQSLIAQPMQQGGGEINMDVTVRDGAWVGTYAEWRRRNRVAPPSAPVGVEGLARLLERIRDLLASLPVDCLGSGTDASGQPYPIRDEVIHGITKALAQQPAAVDEAMVDRACDAYVQIADDCMGLVRRKAMAAALSAALAAQQQGGSDDA